MIREFIVGLNYTYDLAKLPKTKINFEGDAGQKTSKFHNQCHEKRDTKFFSESNFYEIFFVFYVLNNINFKHRPKTAILKAA